MRTLLALALVLALQDHPGAKPAPKEGGWLKRHEGFAAEAKKGGIDLLFLGDSITDAWRSTGKKIFEERFAPLKAANFGISGDRTQHVLWRLQNGEFEGLAPRAVMLMIGTNNIGQAQGAEAPESAAAGVEAILKEIRSRSPNTKVLLLAVFPRGEKPEDPKRKACEAINAMIKKHDDGGKSVRYLDIGARFLQPDGTISKEIMPDYLHLTPKGYEIWADAVKDPIAELLKG
jgi:lysophospholipase L1-like esterase